MGIIKSYSFEGDDPGFVYSSHIIHGDNHGIQGSYFRARKNEYYTVAAPTSSGNYGLSFWFNAKESEKREDLYPIFQPTYLSVNRSSLCEANLKIDYSGNITWNVNGVELKDSGVDIGRWNLICVDIDESNGNIGLSTNGGDKLYGALSGNTNFLSNDPFSICLINENNNSDGIGIDEFIVFSDTISNEKSKDIYSNMRGYQHSGKLDTLWMYPQSSPDNTEYWGSDKYHVNHVPTTSYWEYLNDTESTTLSIDNYQYPWIENIGEFNGLFSPVQDAQLKLGFGKLFIKPSSIKPYVRCYFAEYGEYDENNIGIASGQYTFNIYDKNDSVICSGGPCVFYRGDNGAIPAHPNGYQVYITSDVSGSYREFPTTINENNDFSEVYGIFSFKKYPIWGGRNNGLYPDLVFVQNARIQVSGTPIAYTGLNLIGSGGIDRNSNLDLYLRAYSSGFASKDLYLAGHLPDNSGIPLYTYGSQPINSGIDLYMYGWDTRSSGINLFIGGQITLNSGCDLYMYGSNVDSAGLNLFTKYEPVERSGGFNLFTFSASDPTVQKSMDLYLKTALASSVVGNMNLYMTGPETGSMYGDMPLFLENNTYNYKSVELFLQNAYQSGFKGLKLFVDGEGTLDGGLPYNGSMPLFIERTEGAEKGLSMFMQVNNGVGSGLNMFTKGGTYSQSGLDLSIPSTYAENSGILKLMIRGY